MDQFYENVKKDVSSFVSNLDAQKLTHYAHSFGKFIGLRKENNRVVVSPQYVLATQVLFPYYTGRTVLLASTAAVMFLPDEKNFSKK